jgi:hypothetical protein
VDAQSTAAATCWSRRPPNARCPSMGRVGPASRFCALGIAASWLWHLGGLAATVVFPTARGDCVGAASRADVASRCSLTGRGQCGFSRRRVAGLQVLWGCRLGRRHRYRGRAMAMVVTSLSIVVTPFGIQPTTVRGSSGRYDQNQEADDRWCESHSRFPGRL